MARKCRVCGCTEDNACEGGCSWVEEDLCSACADKDIEDDDLEDDEEASEDVSEPQEHNKTVDSNVGNKVQNEEYSTAQDKLNSEAKKFKGGGKEGAISSHVLETLIQFCKNERFAEAILQNKGTFGDCLKKIVTGVGNSISDLEVYQRATAYYFPNAKISFSMNIDVDGLEMPVQSKEVVATMPAENTKAEVVKPAGFNPFKQETKRITVDLSEFF